MCKSERLCLPFSSFSFSPDDQLKTCPRPRRPVRRTSLPLRRTIQIRATLIQSGPSHPYSRYHLPCLFLLPLPVFVRTTCFDGITNSRPIPIRPRTNSPQWRLCLCLSSPCPRFRTRGPPSRSVPETTLTLWRRRHHHQAHSPL